MEKNIQLLIELRIISLISYWWFFIQTNVNPTLGNIYTNITIGAMVIALVDAFYGEKTIILMQVGSFFECYALVESKDNKKYFGSEINNFLKFVI